MIRWGVFLLLGRAIAAQTSPSLETVIQHVRSAYRTDLSMGVMPAE
jgi:hypothetical protein